MLERLLPLQPLIMGTGARATSSAGQALSAKASRPSLKVQLTSLANAELLTRFSALACLLKTQPCQAKVHLLCLCVSDMAYFFLYTLRLSFKSWQTFETINGC